MSQVSPSVYVGQLRRAFLLRVHPDRFRSHGAEVQTVQARLVAAIGERLNDVDFQRYIGNASVRNDAASLRSSGNGEMPYFLHRRDGSLLRNRLRLRDSPFEILTDIAKALQESGAAVSPPPLPVKPEPARSLVDEAGSNVYSDDDLWNATTGQRHHGMRENSERDLHSFQGRNVRNFVASLDRDDIEQRKLSRMAASTAALMARRLYSFQSIDGTRTGWSSGSFHKILLSLIQLHEDHGSKMLESFYPLQLVFSSDDLQGSYDFYGGEVHLHPSKTPNQWLPILTAVTSEQIDFFQHNRRLLHERQAMIQRHLGVRISKGHSCPSMEFHRCIEHYASHLAQDVSDTDGDTDPADRRAVTEEGTTNIVVESPQSSRIPRVSNNGSIQINYQIDYSRLTGTISRLNDSARNAAHDHRLGKERYAELIERAQWNLGVGRVHKAGHVRYRDAIDCLTRLLETDNDLEGRLSGMSVQIVGRGSLCAVGDDGSLLLPCDFV